jgi:hypothetical protein
MYDRLGIGTVPPIKSAREPWLVDGAATTDLPRAGMVLLPGSIGAEAMNEPTIPSDAGRSRPATVSDRVHELLNATPADLPVAWKMSHDVLDTLLTEVGCSEAQRRDLMQYPMRLYSINIYVEAELPPNTLMLVSEAGIR